MSSDQFEHVKALIRELHAPPKNVSRPKSNTTNSILIDLTTTNDGSGGKEDGGIDGGGGGGGGGQRRSSFTDFINSTQRHLRRHSSISSLSVPSVIITDVNDIDHHDNSHRRFSQFNFGLRRFSHSNTVFL